MNHKLLAWLWVALLLVMSMFLTTHVRNKPSFDSDIFSLLPQEEQSGLVRHANGLLAQKLEREILVMVGDASAKQAVAAVRAYEERIVSSDVVASVALSTGEDPVSAFAPYRHGLLAPEQRAQLQQGDVEAVGKELAMQLYGFSPLSAVGGISHDPLALFSGYVKSQLLPLMGRFRLVSGVPVVDDGTTHYAVLRLHLRQSPFALSFQKQVLQELDGADAVIRERFPASTLLRSGLLFHIAHGAEMATHEISWMSTVSIIGISVLFLLIFRSVRPFAATLSIILLGGVAGMSACLLLFGKIHLLTLVFGTSLVGIAVDYALHFFAQYYQPPPWSSYDAARHIRPGILLGLGTTLFGFIGICIMPFPGLQQMAVFCFAGLVFSCGGVLFWCPHLFRRYRCEPAGWPYSLMERYCRLLSRTSRGTGFVKLLSAVSLAGLVTLAFVPAKDDVRSMQPLSTKLLANDKKAIELLDVFFAHQFFLITGDTAEKNLRLQERLTQKLDRLVQQGELGRYRSVSMLVPSIERQQENRRLLKDFLDGHYERLLASLDSLGLEASLLRRYSESLNGAPDEYLTVDALAGSPLKDFISALWLGEINGKYVSLVSLDKLSDRSQFEALEQGDEIIFMDRTADISALLARYRMMVTLCIVLSYLMMCVFLARYYHLRKACAILAPSLAAAILSLLFVSALFGSYSLFNLMALFLVIGIGADYALFLTETKRKYTVTMIAVLLSACTTILAFGLLAFSQTTVLRDFGVTVAMGIMLTFILAPFANITSEERKNSHDSE